MSAYISILYQRNLTSKYEKEFSALQLECEGLLEKTSKLYDVVDKANQKLGKLLPFGNEIAQKEKVEAEQEIRKMNVLIDQKMARVEELRQLILRERVNE